MIVLMFVVSDMVEGVNDKNPNQIRFEKRGPGAWRNFFERPAVGLERGGTTRLLVHAVADATTLQWIPKVRAFLMAQRLAGNRPSTIAELDKTLAQYLDYMCYAEQRSPSIGTLVFFGLLCLAPELKGKLPLSARSLKSWAKLAVSVEGGPVPEEMIFLTAIELFRGGCLYEG